ncbi:nose resistant to fluoxetine protein 6-like isoform X1 [Photinus pyralis]|uniref:nose resistant to fluoxetine protein 6-like isoform X1 n=1 Tax=Photinus pyralis TaxID=7054 RepID=UPI0012676085|nr:nose resistant to fluoxetine protein 6-like isoform X1 [Photinus pyralis]
MKNFGLIFLLGLKIAMGNYLGERFEALSSPKLYSKYILRYLSQETVRLTPKCYDQLADFALNLKEDADWALDMYDAAGKLPAGVLSGNFVSMGFFDECMAVEELRMDNASISGKYCLGLLGLDLPKSSVKRWRRSTSQITVPTQMNFSVCFPNSCTASDIENTAIGIGLNFSLNENMCQTKATQAQITTGGYVTLALAAVILFLVIASTIYEVTYEGEQHWALKAFSVRSNSKRIFTISRPSPTKISCLSGLRVLAMTGAIVTHVYFYRYRKKIIMNAYYMTYWKNQFINTPLVNPDMVVDVFLLISGFLLSYTYLYNTAKGHQFNIVTHYVGRYLRLTPCNLTVLLFMLTWFQYIGSGPLWNLADEIVEPCRTNWWSYLLYVQNFTPTLCIPPTWYLSVDFQMFIFSPILLIPLKHWPRQTFIFTIFLTLMSIITLFVLAWVYKMGASFYTHDSNYDDYFYFFLPTRASSWLIGFIYGYILYMLETKREPTKVPKRLIVALLLGAIIVMLICLFGTYHIDIAPYNRFENSFCLALIRPALLVAVGYLICCCHMGYGGIVNTFLSNPVFEVVARLSFNIYLVHYLIVEYNICTVRVPVYISNYSSLVNDLPGVLALSTIAAIVLTLAIELPVQHFVDRLVKSSRKEVRYTKIFMAN